MRAQTISMGLVSHVSCPKELCKCGFDSSGKGANLHLKQTNKDKLNKSDFIKTLITYCAMHYILSTPYCSTFALLLVLSTTH